MSPKPHLRIWTMSKCRRGHEGRYPSGNCIACAKANAKRWKAANIAKVRGRQREYSRAAAAREGVARKERYRAYALLRHGLNRNDYLDILADQGGGCAICKAKPPRGVLSLQVDHDHAHCPGEHGCEECVRGLLCSACNAGLGNFKDDVTRLSSAIKYLRRPKS